MILVGSPYWGKISAMRKILLFFFILTATVVFAQRDPVLKQIDLPHNYYYREMYLPQLTTGPSWVTWSPDSKSVIYSMGGSLWKQEISADVAVQLTAGTGYDYEPDWSPDGKRVAFARYNNDAVELQLLNLETRAVTPLTSGGAVNLEPKWSPDGSRIAFVSTSFNKHLHIFLATLHGDKAAIEQLTEEHKSEVKRYYYSAIDHEISPTWSPDGTEIIFVSNPEDIYGTGGFWRMKAIRGAERKEIRYEETTWRAHPDWSPDGKRLIYSSYLGRNWHQLWIMTSSGGDPFPLTYGDYDITVPRWSKDGSKIAFISNKDGNTSLWIQDVIGGKQRDLKASRLTYARPMATLKIKIMDENGKPTAARIMLTGEDGLSYAPADSWISADDSFVRSERPFEVHYFHTQGESELVVPAGKITVDVMKGFEYEWARLQSTVEAGQENSIALRLKPLAPISDWGNWASGDVHVHMNYCGTYRNTPKTMMMQAAAENLPVVFDLIVNKEQRIPDIELFSTNPDPVSTDHSLLFHSQEYHTSYWGHLGLLGLKDHFLIPGYVSYPNTGAASPYPTNSVVSDEARAQGALVGYVHPFDTAPDPAKESVTNELPVDVALGKVDYIEVMGFSDHQATATVWYRLLNCGFRLPTAAGTDAMANFASLRGPVGLNRVYVRTDGHLDADRWLQELKLGHTFASNGPLLQFKLDGKEPGDEISLTGKKKLQYRVAMRSLAPIEHLQIVSNGKVVKEIALNANHQSADETGTIEVQTNGWCVLRAWSATASYPILDLYPYATTSPVYVTVKGKPLKSPDDARYFVAWIDKMIESAGDHPGYNTDSEKEQTLHILKEARQIFSNRQ